MNSSVVKFSNVATLFPLMKDEKVVALEADPDRLRDLKPWCEEECHK